MTATKNAHALCDPVAERIAAELLRIPAKQAARMLETSVPTIARMRARQLPSAALLLKAIKRFGPKIIEPVIGKFDSQTLITRLDALEQTLGEMRHARGQSAVGASPESCRVGTVGGSDDGGGKPNWRLVRPAGAKGDTASAAAAVSRDPGRCDGEPAGYGAKVRRHMTPPMRRG